MLSISRAVTTRIKPPVRRGNTTNAKRPSRVSPNANVEFLASSPDLIVAGKDLFDFIGGELVPLDMKDVAIVAVEPRNNHHGQRSTKYIQIATAVKRRESA